MQQSSSHSFFSNLSKRLVPSGALALCAAAGLCQTGLAAPAETVRIIHNIVYATGYVVSPEGVPGTKALTLDIFLPAQPDSKPRPALLLTHGGSFTGGSPRDMEALGRFFTDRGFICFANAYRLRKDIPGATPAGAMADTMAAVRWVRHHAEEYGARSDAIGALGYSAGAFAVLAVATANDSDFRVDGDSLAPFNTPGESARLQAAVIVSGGLFSEDSLDAKDPPLLVIHGMRDQVVALARGQAIHDACIKKGITCKFVPIEKADHWPLNGAYQGRNVKEYAAEFLHKQLANAAVTGSGAKPPVAAAPSGLLYRLKVNSSKYGHIKIEPKAARYEQGTSVRVVALPAPGFMFAGWTTEGVPPSNPLMLSIKGDTTLAPVFKKAEDATLFTLDTSATKRGTVTCDPAGGTYRAGTVVRLAAVDNKQFTFGYWAGDVREVRQTCYVVMDRNRRVEAGFVPRPDAARVTLRSEVFGEGTLTIEPSLTQFVKGDTVEVRAMPGRGARFSHWEGDLSGDNAQTSLTMDKNKAIVAVFETMIRGESEVIRLSSEANRTVFRNTGALPNWKVDSLWPVDGLQVDRAQGNEVTLTCTSNPTAYSRTAFLRLTAPELVGRFVDIPVIQEGVEPATGSNTPGGKGLAVFTGLPGETGRLAWSDAPGSGAIGRVINANQDGTFTLATQRGTFIGFLMTDGKQPLSIPDGKDYHIHASWYLPAAPEVLMDPDEAADNRASYCYVGIDSGSVNNSALRFGIEWKNLGNGNEWVVRGQFEPKEFSALAQNGGKVPHHISVHVWKDYSGGQTAAIVRAEYSLDFGPWQLYAFTTASHPDLYPIGALGEDKGDDLVTFKVRGLASAGFGGLRVEGASVPPVNLGLDSDGDKVPNEKDPFPANARYSSSSAKGNAADADGNHLVDDWEVKHLGRVGQDPWADPDRDLLSNHQEMLRGSDPLAADKK